MKNIEIPGINFSKKIHDINFLSSENLFAVSNSTEGYFYFKPNFLFALSNTTDSLSRFNLVSFFFAFVIQRI